MHATVFGIRTFNRTEVWCLGMYQRSTRALYIDGIRLSSVRSLKNHRMPLMPLGLSHLSSRSTCQFLSMRKIGEGRL